MSVEIFPAVEVFDGAGVRLKRYIGTQYIRELDPFLLLDEFKSQNPEDYRAGFPQHPHRGFQTLTYMIKGRFKHEDSTGAEGILKDGWLQWMNAGSGVIHSEMPIMENGFLWGFQLWLNNPSKLKMSDPFYYNFPAEEIEMTETYRVINLVGKPMKENGFYPFTYLHIELKKGAEYGIKLEKENNSFIALSEGKLRILPQDVEIPFSHLAVIKGDEIRIVAEENSVFLFASAKPLNEPIARWGPFVMNTMEEIERTIEDYRKGRFIGNLRAKAPYL